MTLSCKIYTRFAHEIGETEYTTYYRIKNPKEYVKIATIDY